MHVVLGAGGFIGQRLMVALRERGSSVRALVRHPRAAAELRAQKIEIVEADLLDRASLDHAFAHVDTIYYLVHSLRAGRGYEGRDARAVDNTLECGHRAGARRIVYVGGLGASATSGSLHLRSRYDVEQRIAAGPIAHTILRAAAVLGRGGASFEVLRDVASHMPVIPMLSWRATQMQPIAIADLIEYLVTAPAIDEAANRTFDVGCPSAATYAELIDAIVALLGHRRLVVRVPGYWPALSAAALRVITSVPAPVVRALIPGLREDMICRDTSADEVFGFRPTQLHEALKRALEE